MLDILSPKIVVKHTALRSAGILPQHLQRAVRRINGVTPASRHNFALRRGLQQP